MEKIYINLIDPATAKVVCRLITATLPEWFGIPEANQRYAHGMLSRVSFAASIDHTYVGLITLEFPYPGNANIYWMAVNREHQGKSIGRKLLRAAEQYCYENGYVSLTVETLSPKQNFIPYLKTYHFYEKCGFKPLFEMHTYGPDNLMVYMQKNLSLDYFTFVDLTHTLTPNVPNWDVSCGFENSITYDYHQSDAQVKFRVQHLQMRAGIGTHMDAPAHCISGGLTISEVPLLSLITRCYVINVADKAHQNYLVTVDDIQHFEEKYERILKNSLVIIHTGWSHHWNNPEKYRNNLIFPSISEHVADYLLWRDVAGLGIDTLSADTVESGYPVHKKILGGGKYLVENVVNASLLDPTGNYIMTLPIKIKDGTEAPVRLIGLKPK